MNRMQKELIRQLNDELRRDFTRGAAFMTPGVAALGADVAERIFRTVAAFDDFDASRNDIWGERDFGSFEIEGKTIFFKIDYYSKDLTMASPDPSDPTVTTRVITMMLASEY